MKRKIILFNSSDPDGVVISWLAYQLWLLRCGHEDKMTHIWTEIDDEQLIPMINEVLKH